MLLIDLRMNYYALIVSILAPATPELAFRLLELDNSPKNIRKYRTDVTPEDDIDMVKLKNEMTYEELAEVYCMKPCSIYQRVNRSKSGNQNKKRIS